MNRWLGNVIEAMRLERSLTAGLAIIWFLQPWALQMMLHPADVIRLRHWLEGEPVPRDVSTQQLFAGEITACVTLAVLVLLTIGLLTVLYHRLQFSVTLYPVAGLTLGVVGNLLWTHALGFVDPQGIAVGLFPAVLSAFWQRAAESWAQDFVFGRGNRPSFSGGR